MGNIIGKGKKGIVDESLRVDGTMSVAPGVRRMPCCSSSANESREKTIQEAMRVKISNERVKAVVASNDGVDACGVNSTEWLATLERGAYTTARTVGGNKVFELSFHLNRIVESLLLMHETEDRSKEEHERLERLKLQLVESMKEGVHGFQSVYGDHGELKITVLVTVANNIPQIRTHVMELGERARYPVKVMVTGHPRDNPEAKDSEWVRERKILENEKPDDYNEVILVGDDGALFEGLSSNFFALMNGSLYTAGSGVLLGSVREAVLRVAESMNIPVVLEAPLLEDIGKWEAAFISSTSRLLLPIDQLFVPDADPPQLYRFEKTDLVKTLEDKVIQEVVACSEPLED
jgi:branched-subunit amino acid aminotransferase/4-amino-4-deoxychorismate lyase